MPARLPKARAAATNGPGHGGAATMPEHQSNAQSLQPCSRGCPTPPQKGMGLRQGARPVSAFEARAEGSCPDRSRVRTRDLPEFCQNSACRSAHPLRPGAHRGAPSAGARNWLKAGEPLSAPCHSLATASWGQDRASQGSLGQIRPCRLVWMQRHATAVGCRPHLRSANSILPTQVSTASHPAHPTCYLPTAGLRASCTPALQPPHTSLQPWPAGRLLQPLPRAWRPGTAWRARSSTPP